MSEDKTGRIVWHDLFTDDTGASRAFYEAVAAWRYATEHATEFAWGGGERDFILAMLHGEAGAGMIRRGADQPVGWVPYVEVADIDAAAEHAVELGGSIDVAPFDVPGVGQNCLLRDPNGARLGIAVSTHDFPVPISQFGADIYLASSGGFPAAFYRGLFGWVPDADEAGADMQPIKSGDTAVAFRRHVDFPSNPGPAWVPSIRVVQLAYALRKVKDQAGLVVGADNAGSENERPLVVDPAGALVFLETE